MAVDRTANVQWSGNLTEGSGTITSTGSGAFSALPVTWASRTEESNGKTSPEELLAMAQAACFAMALSNTLNKAGFPPDHLNVTATYTFAPPKITTMNIQVEGTVPGLDQEQIREIAAQANKAAP